MFLFPLSIRAMEFCFRPILSANFSCVKPEFLLSVYKRENLGVTCLPGHIAIPHGEPAYVTKPAICVAKICHPLDWAGGFVAEIVFLFALDEKCQGFVQNFCDIIKD